MTFEDREKGFESKYAHDEEFQFKVMARRNKLLGLWAANKMGFEGSDADAYAKDVIASDFERAGDEDVFEKVWGDLSNKVPSVTEQEVREQMQNFLEEARNQLYSE